jgi:hypothetical protein
LILDIITSTCEVFNPKYYFFTKYKFPTYLHIFYKISTQSSMNKERRGKIKLFCIKIMYREAKELLYTFGVVQIFT